MPAEPSRPSMISATSSQRAVSPMQSPSKSPLKMASDGAGEELLPPMPSYYPDDPSSIPRDTQAVWLDRPSTPLVIPDVFNRRRHFVTSDLHVMLVTSDALERSRMKSQLEGLHYMTTIASSGKIAKTMLEERGGEFHMVMVSGSLGGEEGESMQLAMDCEGLLCWIREQTSLQEVALIVLAPKSIDAAQAVGLMKAGAHEVLTWPIQIEVLMRFRQLVGSAQSLTQQRAHRREQGGTRLVTQYLVGKERRSGVERMGLPLTALERKDGSAEAPSNPLSESVEVCVLLLQRETRKATELPAIMRDTGYTVRIVRTRTEALKALDERGAKWSLFAVDYASDSVPSVHPQQHDFASSVAGVLREMVSRQVLLPTIAFQEDATTDRVVRTMRLGVIETVLPPYTKGKLRALLRYVLRPTDLRELREKAKALHAAQQSNMTHITQPGGSPAGRDGHARPPPVSTGSPFASSTSIGHDTPSSSFRRATPGGAPGEKLLSPASVFAVARMAAVRAVVAPRRQGKHSTALLTARQLERRLRMAERRLERAERGEATEQERSLTRTALRRRLSIQRALEAEKATAATDEIDERLTTSAEAIEAFQKAADAARRNALKLSAALEREIAREVTEVTSRSRKVLEQRVGAANAAAAALQNRLDTLKRQHARRLEAASRGGSPTRLGGGEDVRHSTDEGSEEALERALQSTASLLMVPQLEAAQTDGALAPHEGSWRVLPRAHARDSPRPHAPNEPPSSSAVAQSLSMPALLPKAAHAPAKPRALAGTRTSGGSTAVADASEHGKDCTCLHCSRRAQLLQWRDSMRAAQSDAALVRAKAATALRGGLGGMAILEPLVHGAAPVGDEVGVGPAAARERAPSLAGLADGALAPGAAAFAPEPAGSQRSLLERTLSAASAVAGGTAH